MKYKKRYVLTDGWVSFDSSGNPDARTYPHITVVDIFTQKQKSIAVKYKYRLVLERIDKQAKGRRTK